MLTSIEGVYENGMVHLLEPLPKSVTWARVVVTVLPDTLAPSPRSALSPVADNQEKAAKTPHRPLTGDDVVDHYQPRTEMGRKLIELRRAYIENGGALMTQDEVLAEVRRRRGEVDDD